eukprot:505903-Amphidinium_carterae.1
MARHLSGINQKIGWSALLDLMAHVQCSKPPQRCSLRGGGSSQIYNPWRSSQDRYLPLISRRFVRF